MRGNRFTVLLVEDSADDAALLLWALRKCNQLRVLGVMVDGEQTVSYFDGRAPYKDRHSYPIPDILLIDLRMPRMSGLDVMEHLRTSGRPGPKLVVMITSDARAADIHRAHQLGAVFISPKQGDYRPVVHRICRAAAEHFPEEKDAPVQ